MASAVDSRLAYARLSAVATASRLPTANRGSNNSYTTSWDTTWWMDKTTGVINKKHHGKKQTRKNLMRDVLIAETVSMIHDVTDLPYEFDAPKSGGEPWTACHSVAKRLGMPYATVRSIWRKNRVYGDLAREEGLSPAARKRRRRR